MAEIVKASFYHTSTHAVVHRADMRVWVLSGLTWNADGSVTLTAIRSYGAQSDALAALESAGEQAMTTEGYLHVFMTGERVSVESAVTGDYVEAGYVDPDWSWHVFQDRNNAGTVLSVPMSHPDRDELVRDVVDRLLGAYADNGDGTLYGIAGEDDYATGDHYSYALHFVHKFYGGGREAYIERPWYGVSAALESTGE